MVMAAVEVDGSFGVDVEVEVDAVHDAITR